MIKGEGEKQVDALKTLKLKVIEGKSNNQSIIEDIYNKILEERINEILKMRK